MRAFYNTATVTGEACFPLFTTDFFFHLNNKAIIYLLLFVIVLLLF